MGKKEFFKKMHPNSFSDSKIIKKAKLSKDFFSYYLDTLTNQSKEKDFEEFCRKLIEVVICPNLIPQTGPTGGGDSKVDSETYPVSESIAETWLNGYADSAHKERWAFAISAKKDWKHKLKSDVAKIIKTNEDLNRNYKKIFFITNQFVPDKKRAAEEDSLRNQYQIDVRILDKNWILDKTFIDNNINIAIEAFNMSEDLTDVIEEGPNDIVRKKRINEINSELKYIEKLKPSKIIRLSQESVLISRELEVDKSLAIAILDRNINFCKKYGTLKDYANALYDYCWTMIWWYEDCDIYYDMYVELENLYKKNIDNYSILKDLSTLWITLYSNHNSNEKRIDNMENHTKFLVESFYRFINDKENPKRAKLAKFDYQMVRLQNPDKWESVIDEYIDITKDINFNNDIDLIQLKKILELPILKNCSKYDDLFDQMIDLLAERSKNIELSQLLTNRGDDYLEKDIYKSIVLYSKALTKLYSEESKIDLVKTLLKLGYCFEQKGLLWGARSYYAKAFMESLMIYFYEGNVIPGLFLSVKSMKYLELKLRRIDYSIELNEIEQFGKELYPYELNREDEEKNYMHYDCVLAIELLHMDLENMKWLNKLPDYLNKISLNISSAALKYKFGYYDEEYIKDLKSKEAIDEFMENLYNQPAANELKQNFYYVRDNKNIKLQTKIMGCKVVINFEKNENIVYELGATIIAMLENIFATSVADKIIAVLYEFNINIKEVKGDKFNINIEKTNNNILLEISKINELMEFDNKDILFEKLNYIVGMFIIEIIKLPKDIEKIKKSIETENAMFRSINYSSTIDTFLINEEQFLLNDKTQNMKEYINIRDNDIFVSKKSKKEENSVNSKDFKYEKSFDKFDFSKVSHNNMEIDDIIYIPLWDKAKWRGLCVCPDLDFIYPPFVSLVFENEAGIDIFKKWEEEDKINKVKIGIITGINKNNPYWYRVIIGADFDNLNKENINECRIFNYMSRLHNMEAKNNNTITLLKRAIQKHKKFKFGCLLVKDIKENNYISRNNYYEKPIEDIIMKDVSEINEDDVFLISGVMPTDIPVNNSGKEMYIEKIIKEK